MRNKNQNISRLIGISRMMYMAWSKFMIIRGVKHQYQVGSATFGA